VKESPTRRALTKVGATTVIDDVSRAGAAVATAVAK
jgi:hypothetical protein